MMVPKLIGLTGSAGVGKDTVAALLVKHLGYTRYAFADPMKQALKLLGIVEPATRAEKEALLPGKPYSYRKAAQTLGTEWGRALESGFWLNLAQKNIEGFSKTVISDIRFEDEAAWIRSSGGVVWHVRGRASTVVGKESSHISESGIWIHEQDETLDNSTTLLDLGLRVSKLLFGAVQCR